MKKFVINRATWARGPSHTVAALGNTLLSPNGCRCCLGFYLSACGVADADLFLQGDPAQVRGLDKVSEVQWLLRTPGDVRVQNSEVAEELIKANDETLHSRNGYTKTREREQREQRVAELFAKQGIEVVFEGP